MTDAPQPTAEATQAPANTDGYPKAGISRVLSRHDRTFLMHEAAKAHPFDEVKYMDGPYVGDDGNPTDAGRDLVMKSVAAGNLQDFVADQLGMKPRAFGKLVKTTSGVWAGLWAVANAAADSALIRLMVWRATILKDPESLKFVLRIRGFSEKTAPTTLVNIDNANTVSGMGNLVVLPVGLSAELEAQVKAELAAQGKFTLPGPMSDAAYAAQIEAQGGVHDARSDAAKKQHAEVFALAPPSCDDPTDDDGGGIV